MLLGIATFGLLCSFTVPKRLYAAAVSLSKRYCLVVMLKGRAGPVNSFSFNLNGSLLASGGDDEEVQIPFALERSVVICCFFISRAKWVVFQTLFPQVADNSQSDFVEVSCLHAFNHEDSVEAFAFDPNFGRIAVSSHYGGVKMLRFQGTSLMEV